MMKSFIVVTLLCMVASVAAIDVFNQADVARSALTIGARAAAAGRFKSDFEFIERKRTVETR